MNRSISPQQWRSMMFGAAPRWKVRVAKAFAGSFEFWNFLDPKAVQMALASIRNGEKALRFTTKAERKAVKKILNAPPASASVPSV